MKRVQTLRFAERDGKFTDIFEAMNAPRKALVASEHGGA